MYIAVLRASGKTFDPDLFVRLHQLTPDVVWHAGELGPGGRVRPESGFNLTIADVPSPREIMSAVRASIDLEGPALRALRDAGVGATIDVGLTVGGDPMMTASVRLSRDDLATLVEAGVQFEVSAYPAGADE